MNYMVSPLMIYLIDMLETFNNLLSIITLIIGCIIIYSTYHNIAYDVFIDYKYNEYSKKQFKFWKKMILLFSICSILLVIIPSKETMYKIIFKNINYEKIKE